MKWQTDSGGAHVADTDAVASTFCRSSRFHATAVPDPFTQARMMADVGIQVGGPVEASIAAGTASGPPPYDGLQTTISPSVVPHHGSVSDTPPKTDTQHKGETAILYITLSVITA